MDRLILFAPGAGAPSSHPWMRRWAGHLGALGRVVPMDYPYQREGRSRPDPQPVLVAAHQAALSEARAGAERPERVVLAGKSMGGRMGCHVATSVPVDAVIAFGYPLYGQGDRSKSRDAVLRALRTPIAFVIGDRDPMCPLDDLRALQSEMTAPSTLIVVPSADHALEPRKRALATLGTTLEALEGDILARLGRFLERPDQP